MQRFQLSVYPDDPGPWHNIDRGPDTKAKARAFALFEKLNTLDPLTIGAIISEGEEIPFLHFTHHAQELFDGWRSDLELKIHSREEHPALEAHLSKYRSLMPSLALPFHLLEVVDGVAEGAVSQRAAATAAAWCDFLEAHARRIYQGVTQHALFAAKRLSERITASALPSPFTAGAVLRKGWSDSLPSRKSGTRLKSWKRLPGYGLKKFLQARKADGHGFTITSTLAYRGRRHREVPQRFVARVRKTLSP